MTRAVPVREQLEAIITHEGEILTLEDVIA